jgi:hypothetical protein
MTRSSISKCNGARASTDEPARVVTFTFGCGRRRRELRMSTAYGQRHYAIDLDRPVEMKHAGKNTSGDTDTIIHRYTDVPGEPWRDAHGNPLQETK